VGLRYPILQAVGLICTSNTSCGTTSVYSSKIDDVDSLHVVIDNLHNPLVEFCFIKDIDMYSLMGIGMVDG
jgi:hypothetical protein